MVQQSFLQFYSLVNTLFILILLRKVSGSVLIGCIISDKNGSIMCEHRLLSAGCYLFIFLLLGKHLSQGLCQGFHST